MSKDNKSHRWEHDHSFGQDAKRPGESRTLIVIAITGTMMVVEIVAGLMFGSMALLADGLHMASHAAALGISAFAYVYARRQAHNATFNFGTGKVNALGGFSGAVLLVVFAIIMAWESIHRLINPVDIVFNQAILVAILGLVVNGVCVFILGVNDHHHHHDDHSHGHHGHSHSGHDSDSHHHHNHDHDHNRHGHHDHNLKSAYLHVLADALTSVLAIAALLAAKYFGLIWMDPVMGLIGAVLVARWSVGLIRSTSGILLDRQAPDDVRQAIWTKIHGDHVSRITDLHVWSIGPGIYAAVIAVATEGPYSPDDFKSRLPESLGLVHVSIEVNTMEKNSIVSKSA